MKLRAMIARFEDTRDLRLMGGYQAGQDAELDQAIVLVPKIYAAMAQGPRSPASEDGFRELADAMQIRNDAAAGLRVHDARSSGFLRSVRRLRPLSRRSTVSFQFSL